MAVESAADRAAFISSAEFGASAVYTPTAGAASDPIDGLFDNPSRSAAIGDIGAIDAAPSFFCRASDLPTAAVGDAGDSLVVDGDGSYQVTAIEPDGAGMVLLRLGAV